MASTRTAARDPRLSGPERRQQIIASARAVFLRHGLGGARTRHIADEAGVNEALLYHHFPSKEAIFEEAVLQPLQAMLADLFETSTLAPEAGEARPDVLRRTVRGVVEAMNEMVPLLGMVLFSDEETGRRFYRERYLPLLREGYRAGRPAMSGWVAHPIHPSVATAVHGMCWVAAMDHWFRRTPLDEEQMVDVLCDLILNWKPAS